MGLFDNVSRGRARRLHHIAAQDPDWRRRADAYARLGDHQQLCYQQARYGGDVDAARQLGDQALLLRLATADGSDTYVQAEAVERLDSDARAADAYGQCRCRHAERRLWASVHARGERAYLRELLVRTHGYALLYHLGLVYHAQHPRDWALHCSEATIRNLLALPDGCAPDDCGDLPGILLQLYQQNEPLRPQLLAANGTTLLGTYTLTIVCTEDGESAGVALHTHP